MTTGGVSSNAPVDWTPIIFGVLAAGVAFRLLWTAAGLWRLRRLRAAGTDVTANFAEQQQTVGTCAEIRCARSAEQPVTFGLRRPVVLLPDSLLEQRANIQQAVVCHELMHVRRRDWVWLLAEETLRAVLWFHPAVWFALSRIQLTREEVVDAEVVQTTRERRAYVEALMAFADEAPLTPVAAFSRRRHLFRRILLISKEASMSPARVVVSCLVMALVAGTGSWYAAWAFPLQVGAPVTAPRPGVVAQSASSDEVGPLERQAKPVTAENPVPRRTYAASPQYPTAAGEARGVARIRVTLDAQGRVAELRNLGARSRVTYASAQGRVTQLQVVPLPSTDADRLFFDAAVEAVRQWQYEPPYDAPISFDVTLAFTPANRITSNITPRPVDEFAPRYDDAKEEYSSRLRAAQELASAGQASGAPERELRAARERLLEVEREFEERIRAGQTGGGEVRTSAVRVGGAVRAPTKTKHVAPAYPEDAKAAGVQGVVIAEATISAEGRVEDARVLRSIPLLDQAALDALRQWEFTPTLLNGTPIPIIMTVTVQFTLSDF
jgi:TonB family protein